MSRLLRYTARMVVELCFVLLGCLVKVGETREESTVLI